MIYLLQSADALLYSYVDFMSSIILFSLTKSLGKYLFCQSHYSHDIPRHLSSLRVLHPYNVWLIRNGHQSIVHIKKHDQIQLYITVPYDHED
jgi:hypothetical protein